MLSCSAHGQSLKYVEKGIVYSLNAIFNYTFEPMEYEGRVLTSEARKYIV